MDKLEQMEIMKKRMKNACDENNENIFSCSGCKLENISKRDGFCFACKNDIQDYDKLKEHCEIMGIDISDLIEEIPEEESTGEETKVFTVSDIKPGYLLLVDRGTIKSLMIGLPTGDNEIGFYIIEGGGSIGMRLFILDDILPDFTTKKCGHKIEKVYGYNTKNHNMCNPKYRPVLWAKSDKEYQIYENGQKILIKPNLNTYFNNEKDGDIFITDYAAYPNHAFDTRYISIKRENLKAVIDALQEIQQLYEESEDK